ncbi:IS3 family transposase [Lutibacter sp. A64]|uniref:IS3 family transposase n=1 Tax=Lutibacter sp. A64 TaxID=2918526 RepID=UPI001F06452F|nr:IS3 family transposase [Lutibacter sp. A64]UMB52616.1 IS3 family transposase [Lutibacter sp. A64]
MAESTHSIYKTEFLRGEVSRTIKNHLGSLQNFVHYYNYQRYPTDLYGLTTIEVIQGKIPDKDYFKNQIIEAKINRVTTNKAFNKCAFIR